MTGKIDRFIMKPYSPEHVVYHDIPRALRELGPLYHYMDSSQVPETDIHIGVREIKQVPPDFKPHLEPHKHEVSEVYMVIGDLTVEVMLEGERREVTGPASFFIPAGMMHTYRPLRGSGYLVVVYRGGEYKASSDT